MHPKFGTPKKIIFPFRTNEKYIISVVPILRYIMVAMQFFYYATFGAHGKVRENMGPDVLVICKIA